MKNLQEATERICELKGSLVALDALVPAVIQALSPPARARLLAAFDAHAEAARTVMLHADISDVVLASFERDVARNRAVLQAPQPTGPAPSPLGSVDALLLTTTPVTAFKGARPLADASGFFFRRADRLFLVSHRSVWTGAVGADVPDRIEIVLHTDAQDLRQHAVVSLPLHHAGRALWREATDGGGVVDVAALEIPTASLPGNALMHAFEPGDLDTREAPPAIGDALTLVGFPVGDHDTVHHLPVARRASLASAHGVHFRQRDCFLTDAPSQRGLVGAPVVRRRTDSAAQSSPLPWQLLGVHSSGLDGVTTEPPLALASLHCAWFADLLLPLTAGD